MSRRRFLLYFSYIGTDYKGMQKQSYGPEMKSIQGVLENVIQKVVRFPLPLKISSRTDTGVHAIQANAHIDVPEECRLIFAPEKLCHALNADLAKRTAGIRINKIVQVPLDFSAKRNAYSRSYCYRIAVSKNLTDYNKLSSNLKTGSLPIDKLYRCQVVPQPFDVEQVSAACRVFLGTWNFLSFAHSSKDYKTEDTTEKDFIKTVYRFSFSQAHADYFVNHLDRNYNHFTFYDFNVEASGFLRRQVRRMVGALITLGGGRISYEDILYMLQNPSEKHWNPKIAVVSGEGLFLKSVNYKEVPVLGGSLA